MTHVYFAQTADPLEFPIPASPLSFREDSKIPEIGEAIKPGTPASAHPSDVLFPEEANERIRSVLALAGQPNSFLCHWSWVSETRLRMRLYAFPKAMPDPDGLDRTASWYAPKPLIGRLIESYAKGQKDRDSADERAAAWLDAYIEDEGIDRDTLTKADWFLLTRMVPCHIRCYRVGISVAVEPGQPCPECGKMRPELTAWDRLMEAV